MEQSCSMVERNLGIENEELWAETLTYSGPASWLVGKGACHASLPWVWYPEPTVDGENWFLSVTSTCTARCELVPMPSAVLRLSGQASLVKETLRTGFAK